MKRPALLPVATLLAIALSVVTAVNARRLFSDTTYLRPLLVVVLAVHGVGFLLRLIRVPLLLALPMSLTSLALVAAATYHPSSYSGLLPGWQSLGLLRGDLRDAAHNFATAVVPVSPRGMYGAAVAVALGACAVLSDSFAFRAKGRLEAVLPTAVLFVVVSALGTAQHRVALTTAWLTVAITFVAVARHGHAHTDAVWMGGRRVHLAMMAPAVAITVAVTVATAGIVGPRLPGATSVGLIEQQKVRTSKTTVLSPFVDLGTKLNRDQGIEMFTVESSDGGHYWRMAGLSLFDGTSWSPAKEDLAAVAPSRNAASGTISNQRIWIINLGGHLVPAAAYPVFVSPSQVMIAPAAQTLAVPSTNLQAGDSIVVRSAIPTMSASVLRAAGSTPAPSTADLLLPSDLPAVVSDTARSVTAGADNTYDKMIALQQWFRSNFTYDKSVQFGGGSNAIADFLEARKGFCQQFSASFAAMARSLGVPSRVAVGFTEGVAASDGRFHVYGRHAHAWPEVWFAGVGWVAFEPTPGRGNPDTVSITGIPPGQDGSDTPTTVTSTVAPTTAPPTTASTRPTTPTTVAPVVPRSAAAPFPTAPVVAGGVVLLLLLWWFGAPRVVDRASRRRTRSPAQRVHSSWRRTERMLRRAGAPPSGTSTPVEFAAVASDRLGIDRSSCDALAAAVTRCVYASTDPTDADAVECERAELRVRRLCRDHMPAHARALDHAAPAALWHRLRD